MSPYIKNFQNNKQFSDRKIWHFWRFLNHNLFLIILIFLNIVFSFGYLWQINQISFFGYHLKNLEREISFLKNNNTKLNIKLSGIKLEQNVNLFAKDFGMVTVDKTSEIGYIQVFDSKTALK